MSVLVGNSATIVGGITVLYRHCDLQRMPIRTRQFQKTKLGHSTTVVGGIEVTNI